MSGAGALRTRVRSERPEKVSDGGGGFAVTRVEAFTVYAETIRPGGRAWGREAIDGGALMSATRCTFRVRASTSTRPADSSWRLVDLDRGVTFNIRAAWLTECRGWVDLMAESGVAT